MKEVIHPEKLALLLDVFKPFGLVMRYQREDNFLELSVHDRINLVQRQINPMVSDASLRKIVGANSFTAISGSNLALAVFGDLIFSLLFYLVE